MSEEHHRVDVPQLAIKKTRMQQWNGQLDPAVCLHRQHAEDDQPRGIDEPFSRAHDVHVFAALDRQPDPEADQHLNHERGREDLEQFDQRRERCVGDVPEQNLNQKEVDDDEDFEKIRPLHCIVALGGRKYIATAMIAYTARSCTPSYQFVSPSITRYPKIATLTPLASSSKGVNSRSSGCPSG